MKRKQAKVVAVVGSAVVFVVYNVVVVLVRTVMKKRQN